MKSEAFTAWFGKSRVVDGTGKPLVVYRGEHGDRGGNFQSRLASLSFGSLKAANSYSMLPNNRVLDVDAKEPRVTPAYLRIENPIIESRDGDPFMDLSIVAERLGDDFAREMARKHSDFIQSTSNWYENFSGKYATVADLIKAEPDSVRDLYLGAYHLLDDPEFVAAAKATGYDGAIHGGNGETRLEIEYRIFDPSHVMSAISTVNWIDHSFAALVTRSVTQQAVMPEERA